MWIMIRKEIPVEERYKPMPLGLYWATPKTVDLDILVTLFERYLPYEGISIADVFKAVGISDYSSFIKRNSDPYYLLNRKKFKSYIVQHKKENVFREYVYGLPSLLPHYTLVDASGQGLFEPNYAQDVIVRIGEEPVTLHSYEYSVLSQENMQIYLESGDYTFMPQENIAPVLVNLTKSQSFIKEAALLDGCTDYQASMVALGKDPAIDFPPPLGWYKPHPDLVSMFF